MAMVRKDPRNKIRAVRNFTDREHPREAFRKKYAYQKDKMRQGDTEPCVLMYYGIGGIGKSSLLKKLENELVGRLEKPLYIRHDLGGDKVKDPIEIIKNLSQKLIDKCGFEFPLFDMGYYQYNKLCCKDVAKPDLEPYIERSRLLSFVMDTTGNIPVVDVVPKILTVLDTGQAILRSMIKNNSKRFAEIVSTDDEHTMLSMIPDLFAIDLIENLQNVTEPLVVFLDTYEALVNEAEPVGNPFAADEWLRSNIIRAVPNTLWVIAGREKLKWQEKVCGFDWAEADDSNLEQHCLGTLSQVDVDRFLYEAGIDEKQLRDGLFSLTQGVPLYLDLCVDAYEELVAVGRTPVIGDFGNDTTTLIDRYVCYLDNDRQQLVYIMACLQCWDKDLFYKVADAFHGSLNELTYKSMVNMSFVTCEDGYYRIHSVVGAVLFDNCDEDIRNKALKAAMEYCTDMVESADLRSEQYAVALEWSVRHATRYHTSDMQFAEYYISKLSERVYDLYYLGRTELVRTILSPLYDRASKDTNGILYSLQLQILIDMDGFSDTDTELMKMAQHAYDICVNCSSERSMIGVMALDHLAKVYDHYGLLKQALEYSCRAYELADDLFGKEHALTLRELSRVGTVRSHLSDHEEALRIFSTVLDKYKEMYGDKHFNTIKGMSLVAGELFNLGRFEESLKLKQEILKLRQLMFGEEHPAVINAMEYMIQDINCIYGSEKALEMYEQIYTLVREQFGERSPKSMKCMMEIAYHNALLKRYDISVKQYNEVVEMYTEIYGSDHRLVLDALCGIAFVCRMSGRTDAAIMRYEELRERYVKLVGEEHFKTLHVFECLAELYEDAGQYEKALVTAHYVYQHYSKKLGEYHKLTIIVLTTLESIYVHLRRFPEALRISTEVYRRRLHVLGESHMMTLSALVNKGTIHSFNDDLVSALQCKMEALEKYMSLNRPLDDRWLDRLIDSIIRYCHNFSEDIALLRDISRRAFAALGSDNRLVTEINSMISDISAE